MAEENYGMRADVLLQRAIELKDNPLLDALLKEFQGDAIAKWIATRPEEVSHRESAWYQYLITLEFETRVNNIIAELRDADQEEGEQNG